MKKCIFFLSCLFLISNISFADKIKSPTPFKKEIDSGKYYFTMDPGGKGTLYQPAPSQKDKALWETKGWYAYKNQIFISKDAQYLVRIDSLPAGEKPVKEDIGIAFYKEGDLIKEYSTLELSINYQPTVSHYFWLSKVVGFTNKNKFVIITKSKIKYTFDITTGKIISQEKVYLNESLKRN